jgi:guanylate kinase
MEEDTLSFDVFHPRPLLIVISGPTAVGKDAVIKLMFERETPLKFVVTATTRPRREKEVDGVDYIFVTPQRFDEMIRNNELAEYAWVYNAFKGVPRSQIEPALSSGKDVIMRVDVQGARKVRQLYPDSIQIFMIPRDEAELRDRIRDRRTETEAEASLRLQVAREELAQLPLFDYVVVNQQGQLDEAVDTILAIINAEHHRVRPRCAGK